MRGTFVEMRAPVDRRRVLLQIELVSHNHHRLLQSNEHSEHTLLFSPSTSAISGSHFDSTGCPAHTRPQRHRPTDDGDATDPTSRICSHVMSWSSSKAEDHVARSILTGRIHDGQRCSVRRVICGNYHFAENGIHVFREIVRYKSGDERCLSHARYASQSASNPTVSHHNDSDCFGHTNKHFCKLNNLYTLEK